jgi:hypothetical protein
MSRWHRETPNPYDDNGLPCLPSTTQSWTLWLCGPEPVVPGVPVRAMNELSRAERERERIAKLGNIVPVKSLPRARR